MIFLGIHFGWKLGLCDQNRQFSSLSSPQYTLNMELRLKACSGLHWKMIGRSLSVTLSTAPTSIAVYLCLGGGWL